MSKTPQELFAELREMLASKKYNGWSIVVGDLERAFETLRENLDNCCERCQESCKHKPESEYSAIDLVYKHE